MYFCLDSFFWYFLSSDLHVLGRDWLSLGRWIVLPDFLILNQYQCFFQNLLKTGKEENEINSGSSVRFLILVILIFLSVIFLITTIVFIVLYVKEKNDSDIENPDSKEPEDEDVPLYPSQERYIKVLTKLTEIDGAYAYQGKHDILDSPYFNFIDIYNMKSSGSFILLEKFKTYQQTSEYSCGPASIIMAINYLDGTILDEKDIVEKAHTKIIGGTLIKNMDNAIGELGYPFDSKFNYTEDDCPSKEAESFAEYIKESLRNKEPIIVASNDWGGHYSVIIGYDDMGTEDYISDDIIILADPYDTTDHISDGYTIFSYERFYYQMLQDIKGIEGEKFYFCRVKRKNKN